MLVFVFGMPTYFYPRSPCGERRNHLKKLLQAEVFLSTLSLRRATATCCSGLNRFFISIHALLAESDEHRQGLFCLVADISIHALLAESDILTELILSASSHFYPRSPCGERRERGLQDHSSTDISIHALLAESDDVFILIISRFIKFLSTLSLRRATHCCSRHNCLSH